MYTKNVFEEIYLYYYESYSNIEQDENGFFVKYNVKKDLRKLNYDEGYYNILFNDLICQKDYYFIGVRCTRVV